MKLLKKIIIATGTLFGLALSLSIFQRKTILLTGSIEYSAKTKIEDFKEIVIEKENIIRKVSGNNEGFSIYLDNKIIFETKERNSISAFGLKLIPGKYKVIPISKSNNLNSNVIIELAE